MNLNEPDQPIPIEIDDPMQRDKWSGAMGVISSQATIKRYNQGNWIAYVPGKIPVEVILFLERMFEEDPHVRN